jgi:hypothetical protein
LFGTFLDSYLESHDGTKVLGNGGQQEKDEVMHEQHVVLLDSRSETTLNDVQERVVEDCAHEDQVLPPSSSFLQTI